MGGLRKFFKRRLNVLVKGAVALALLFTGLLDGELQLAKVFRFAYEGKQMESCLKIAYVFAG